MPGLSSSSTPPSHLGSFIHLIKCYDDVDHLYVNGSNNSTCGYRESTINFFPFFFNILFRSYLYVMMLDCLTLFQYPKVSINNIWTCLHGALLLLFWVIREVFHVRHSKFTQHVVSNDFVFNFTQWNPQRMFGVRAVFMKTFEWKEVMLVNSSSSNLSKTSACAHVE